MKAHHASSGEMDKLWASFENKKGSPNHKPKFPNPNPIRPNPNSNPNPKPEGSISARDIPFPDPTMVRNLASNKDNYKKLAKRWHPDKFQQSFGNRLIKGQSEKIMELVKEIFQQINDGRTSKPSFGYMQTG